MNIDTVTSAADGARNEDLIAVFEHDGVTDLLILDGATSVAENDYIDPVNGDVAWFVTHFVDCLGRALSPERTQQESIMHALASLHASFESATRGVAVPAYALPLAALTWLRLSGAGPRRSLQAYCLGDCKSFICESGGAVIDLDPYINPQEAVVQAQIASLNAQGHTDPATRKAKLLPMLRERRIAQNTAASPSVLCLRPDAPPAARVHTRLLEPRDAILAMTDGFYRIVDTYAMMSMEQLAARCLAGGLAGAHAALRAFEADNLGSASLAVKRADDASALLCVPNQCR